LLRRRSQKKLQKISRRGLTGVKRKAESKRRERREKKRGNLRRTFHLLRNGSRKWLIWRK